jgi:D-alanine-D-alanine ligase
MLSLTRDLNPDMPEAMAARIRRCAAEAFEIVGGTGAPRIDFLCDGGTGDFWLNEVNPCPGSFGYFLWEALEERPLLFTELLNHLVDEAVSVSRSSQLPDDPVPPDARLFPRP